MNKKGIFLWILVFALIWTTNVININKVEAGETEFSLEQVVVTATKTPVDLFKTKANISVITQAEIEKRNYKDLAEALKSVPGVTIANYGAGGESYTANGLYINGSANIVVLIDGIRANVNGTVFNKFPAAEFKAMNNIERIEILKGSASTLYGSDAQGGVINIITRKIDSKSTNLKLSGGSYDRENYSFTHQGTEHDFSWLISSKKDVIGDFKDAKKLVIPTQEDAVTNSVKLNKRFGKKADLTLDYQNFKCDYMRSGANNNLNDRNYGEKDNYKVMATYNYNFSKDITNQLAIFKNVNRLNDNYTKPFSAWIMNLETIGVQDQFSKKLSEKHTLTAGLDIYQDKVKDYVSGAVPYQVSYQGKTITNRALYVQDQWKMNDAWNLTSGIRLDNHSVYGKHTTNSITLGYKANDKTNYYIGYNEFFVSPNQYQLFAPQYGLPNGNMNLKAETGRTIETGVNHIFDDSCNGSFHIFHRNSKNGLDFNNVLGQMSSSSGYYYNKTKEKATGWDIQLNKAFNKNLNSFLSYAHMNVEALAGKNPNIDGKLPKGTYNLGLNYLQDKYDLSLQSRGIIEREGRKADKNKQATSYWVWDASFNYKASDTITAFVKVDNIFNRYYTEQSYNLDPAKWYSAPGRNYQIGINYAF